MKVALNLLPGPSGISSTGLASQGSPTLVCTPPGSRSGSGLPFDGDVGVAWVQGLGGPRIVKKS